MNNISIIGNYFLEPKKWLSKIWLSSVESIRPAFKYYKLYQMLGLEPKLYIELSLPQITKLFSDDKLIIELLNKNTQICLNGLDPQQVWTYLIFANSSLSICKYFVDKFKIDLNTHANGMTLLLNALFHQQSEDVIAYLLDNCSYINQRDSYGLKPIHWVTKYTSDNNFALVCAHPSLILEWDEFFENNKFKLLSKLIRLSDEKLCELFVKSDGLFIQIIPLKFKTQTMCRLAYNTSPTISCLKVLPIDFLHDKAIKRVRTRFYSQN
jgi:hypothetical protein